VGFKILKQKDSKIIKHKKDKKNRMPPVKQNKENGPAGKINKEPKRLCPGTVLPGGRKKDEKSQYKAEKPVYPCKGEKK
jgi:hypothetical protein